MDKSLIIIDDFLDNADAFHEVAIKQDYPPHTIETYFTGRNSVEAVPINGIEQVVSSIVGQPLEAAPGTSHCKFRLALDGSEGRGNVHVDRAHWSGILYMTKPEYCQGGTDFFKHKRTGTDHYPTTQKELSDMGYQTMEEVWDNLINPDTNDPSKWEHIMRVPMRYNRLVLFRPWLWHNAGPSFGDSVENGRLIYTLFFAVKGQG